MFDLNNNISTILLLVVLGIVIWYLIKPNKNKEYFSNKNVELNSNIEPYYESNNDNYGEVNLNEDLNQEYQRHTPVQMNSRPIQTKIIHEPEQMDNVETQATREPDQIKPAATQMPQNYSQMIPDLSQLGQNVNDFQNLDESIGADINDAFNPPISNTNKNISAIDINKKNVQDYNAKDFLPKEINNQWFDTDFSQAKTNIEDDKLINTERYVIGINTVGQSLKNASYDIRGTIANPKFSVSPWNNSTYEPDYNIKPLC